MDIAGAVRATDVALMTPIDPGGRKTWKWQRMNDKNAQAEPLISQKTLITFSAMAMGWSILGAAVNVLPQLYAKELGFSLAGLGGALLFIRLFDAFSDQVVGFLSDHTRSRFGSRKPWIVVGSVITVLSCYYLLLPPKGIGIVYFVIWRIVYDIGSTMVGVAYTAWGAELSPNYADRSRINGYEGVSGNIGNVFKNVATIALFWFGITESSHITLNLYQKMFWLCLFLVPVLVSVTVGLTPQGKATTRERPDLFSVIKSIGYNKPFWFYMSGFLIASLGQGILALLFTFYDSYLNVGQYYPYLMMSVGVVIVLGIPVWVRIAGKIGKHKAYAVAIFCMAAATNTFWFVDPDKYSQETVAILGAIILFFIAFCNACTFVAPAAMLADVVDYGTWKTGESSAGSYFAFHSLILKIAVAVGGSLGFIMLAGFGYDVKVGAVNDDFAKFGILTTVILVPSLLKVIGGVIIWNFPLTKKRHDILRRRLASRRPKEAEGSSADTAETDFVPSTAR